MCQFHSKVIFFIVRPVSAVRPSSITGNLRGRYHTSGYNMLLRVVFSLIFFVIKVDSS